MHKIILILSLLIYTHGTFASDDHSSHDHKDGSPKNHTDHDDHKANHSDDHGDDHSEANSKIGPDKGILEVQENLGFKISPQAIANFGMKSQKLNSNSPWDLPTSARMFSQEEVNLYRIRDGFIKRIDFTILSKTQNTMKVQSPDLKQGDEVITEGIGFIRIAEITAYGGGASGHSH